MTRRKRSAPKFDLGESMCGYVECGCGSRNVWGYDRRDRDGRIIGVTYRCGTCGARAKVGR